MPTEAGPAFDFGQNWRAFSAARLDRARLAQASEGLRRLLGADSLENLSFLDVGCGSGLFSVAALELGARQVVGLDIDPLCVVVSRENETSLRGSQACQFLVASATDPELPSRLGVFDIVYAWGSLHHTGALWSAVDNSSRMVRPGGRLVLGLYNRHVTSPVWRQIKRVYVKIPQAARKLAAIPFAAVIYVAKLAVTGRNPLDKERGMDFWYDVIDWIGGYPYEYAAPREVQEFLQPRGFSLERFIAAGVPTGCNEFVYRKVALT